MALHIVRHACSDRSSSADFGDQKTSNALVNMASAMTIKQTVGIRIAIIPRRRSLAIARKITKMMMAIIAVTRTFIAGNAILTIHSISKTSMAGFSSVLEYWFKDIIVFCRMLFYLSGIVVDSIESLTKSMRIMLTVIKLCA